MSGVGLVLAAWDVAEPRALFALALAAPIVGLHLYLKKRRRRLVASLHLVLEGLGPVREAARFRRIRDRLALASRLAALAAWTAALAGLAPRVARTTEPPTAFVIDADRTTSAEEADGRARIEHAFAHTRAWIESLPRGTDGLLAPAAIWRAGRGTERIASFTRDPRELIAALRAATPAPSTATVDLDDAIARATESLVERGGGRIVVLTARALPAREPPGGISILRHGIGATRRDQGVVDLTVESGGEDALGLRLALVNHDTAPVTRSLRTRLGSLPADERDVVLAAGETVVLDVRVARPSVPTECVVELLGRDAWGANDELRAVLPSSPKPSVLLAHGGRVRPYTQAVVDALAPDVDVARSGIVHVRDLARALDPERGRARDVVIVDGAPLPPGSLRPGAWVFLGPLEGELPFELGAHLVEPLVWRTAPGHPLVAERAFSAAQALRGRALVGSELAPLAYADGHVVLAEGAREGVRYVALALDPEHSALPLQADLPLFVRAAVRRLAVAPAVPFAPIVSAGERLRPRAPLALPGPFELRWRGFGRDPLLEPIARGARRGVRMDGVGAAPVVPPDAAGILEVVADGGRGPTLRVGVRPADPGRSIAPSGPASAPPAVGALVPDPVERWRVRFLALGLFLLLLDLALSRASLGGKGPRR